jgi:DNA-binding phage protein
MIDEKAIRARYEALRCGFDERLRRLFAAAEARAAGFGGVSAVARATGIARSTIDRGLFDLDASRDQGQSDVAPRKVRRAGGGRLALIKTNPALLDTPISSIESRTRLE